MQRCYTIDIFAEIRERVPLEQVLSGYGVQLHGKRCKCPVHHGEHLSASVHHNKLHCFKCAQTWDTVALVSELDSLSPIDAAKLLNEQYALGLAIGRAATPEERRQQKKAVEEARKRREMAQAFQSWENYAWIVLSTYYRLLKQWKKDCAPTCPADLDQLDPRYAEAVKRLDYIGYCLDMLDGGTDEQKLRFYRTHRIEVNEIERRMQHNG